MPSLAPARRGHSAPCLYSFWLRAHISRPPTDGTWQGAPLSWLGSLTAVFAVRFAGPRHAATLSGLVDVWSYSILAPYMLLVNHLVNTGHYVTFWYTTASLLIAGSSGLVVLLRLEEQMPPHATLPRPLGLGVAAPGFSVAPLQPAST